MRRKGFTLIELLAVIILLSIILVITVPKINDLIKESQKKSFYNNVLNLFEAVSKLEATSNYKLDEDGIKATDKRLNIPNNIFTGGKIVKNSSGVPESYEVTDDEFCAIGTKKNLSILTGDCDLAGYLNNITYTETPDSGWQVGKLVTIKIKNLSEITSGGLNKVSYSLNGKKFTNISSSNTKLIYGNYSSSGATKTNMDTGTLIVKISRGDDAVYSTYKVTQVDSTKPTDVSVRLAARTTSKMYVVASAVENESYIKKYEFMIDNSGTWTDNGNESSFRFDNVTPGSHSVSVRVTNASGLTASVTRTLNTAELVSPSFVVSPSQSSKAWAQKRSVTISYPMDREDVTGSLKNNYEYRYKVVDQGSALSSKNFTTVTSSMCKIKTDKMGNRTCEISVDLTKNSQILAEVQSGSNVKDSTLTVTGIDAVKPTLSTTYYVDHEKIRLHVYASDNSGGSGLTGTYKCIETASNKTVTTTNGICEFTNLSRSTNYSFKVQVPDNAGNIGEASVQNIKTLSASPSITLTEQTSGNYKKVKIDFPSLGTAATYQYRESSSGSWITASSLSVTTNEIKTNGTVVTARVYYNGEYLYSKSITVNIDITPPTCTWSSGPTGTMQNGYIKSGNTLTYVLKCTDDYEGFSDSSISTSDITSSNTNVATVKSISSATSITKGYQWTVTVEGKSTTGTATFHLNANSVADKVGNKNKVSSESTAVKTDNEKPTCGTVSKNPSGATKDSVTVSIPCTDSKSGCAQSSYTKTHSSNVSNQTLTIADKLGNTNTCSYSVSNIYTLSVSSSKSSKGSYTSCFGNGQDYKYTFNITATGYGVSSGTLCYAASSTSTSSYCGTYSTNKKTGMGQACFNSSTTWIFYRSTQCAYAYVCNSAGKCADKKYQC